MQSLWAVAALLAGAAATTPASEVAALREFYGALGGDGWLDNHLWNSASDPCDGNDPWYGVFCEINASLPNATHVVGIALGYNQLDGTLPASLANLLEVLNTIVLPVIAVLFVDARCLHDNLESHSTEIGVPYCYIGTQDDQGHVIHCNEYRTETYTSTYEPRSHYDGAQCVTAVITTYTPVLVTSSLLTGIFAPAVYLLLPALRAAPPSPNHWLGRLVDINALWGLRDDGAATAALLESAFTTLNVSLSLVMAFGLAAPNVAAAALAATAGTLVTTLHQLGLRQEFERSADSWLSGIERAPWGGLIVALAPLPAVWEFVRFRFLSGRGSDIAVILLPVVLACFAMCSSPPGARRLRRALDRARKPRAAGAPELVIRPSADSLVDPSPTTTEPLIA